MSRHNIVLLGALVSAMVASPLSGEPGWAPAPETSTARAALMRAGGAEGPRSTEPPRIVAWPIPFGGERRREMTAYARRHSGRSTYRLRHPHVIVEHFTQTTSARAAWNTFAPDVPDPELHELPGTCAHFLIARDGTVFQLVTTTIMCRHTVGLNDTAIGVEHVGMSDAQIMGDSRQLHASLRLTRWLRCRDGIALADVIGHNESLTSPYHHERVKALKQQTHADMRRSTMRRYRRMLSRRGSCRAGRAASNR